jgi:outer membrane protein OmpA-like peptidoglycan-associated protein
MKRTLIASALIGFLGVTAGASRAQEVQDFTTHQPTSQELVETLRPRTRGIAIAPVAMVGVGSCQVYRQTRGIAPVADIAALHVTFAFNSAEIAPESLPILKSLGEALKSNELGTSCMQIEGHTDSKGSDAYNQKLSQRRAQSVIRYLAKSFGVEEDRLLAAGKGEIEPIADNSTDAGRQKNRRVQVVNLGAPKAVAQENY